MPKINLNIPIELIKTVERTLPKKKKRAKKKLFKKKIVELLLKYIDIPEINISI